MTRTQLKEYVMRNSNIDFNFNGKRYGIERIEKDTEVPKIFFWEWYNESTFDDSFSDFADFEANAKIDGKSVVEILADIDDADVF